MDFEQSTEYYYETHSITMYHSVWFFLAFNFLLFFGIILLITAYRLNKKIPK